jgi:hypothetical protein
VSNPLGVQETLDLIASLKTAVGDFAAAEEKLNRDQRARTDAATRRFEEEMAAHEAGAAAVVNDAEARFAAGRQAIEARRDKRRARLVKAHRAAHKTSAERITNEEGSLKYRVQKGLLDTKRWREESLKQNDATLAEFNASLAGNRAAFGELEALAQKKLGGAAACKRALAQVEKLPDPDLAPDEYQLLEKLNALHATVTGEIAKFGKIFLPQLFRFLPLWLWIVGLLLVGAGARHAFVLIGRPNIGYVHTAGGAGVLLVLILVAYFMGQSRALPLAKTIAQHLEDARRMYNACLQKSQARHAGEIERIETEARNRTEALNNDWDTALSGAARARELWPAAIDRKSQRANATHEAMSARHLEKLAAAHAEEVGRLNAAAAAARGEITARHEGHIAKFKADHDAHWQKLEGDWKRTTAPLFAAAAATNAAADALFPAWKPELWADWTPPAGFINAARFASLEADVAKLANAAPRDPRLPFPPTISLPLLLHYPDRGSILFETTKSGNEHVIEAINNILFRLLATVPAGKASFTLIDPVKLGQSFAGVMHLSDFEENIINGRIWTQSSQIEQRLADLNEHMEKVIQMYLRNEYETIADYNKQAGTIAEKYHFVVIADFPAQFSETAARRLLHIAASGARCGVFTLIHWDHRHTAPADFFPEELRKASVCISASGEHCVLAHPFVQGTRVVPDVPPGPEFATQFLQRVGEQSRGANRVEVPFSQIAPPENELWSEETTEELRVPIGRTGATKLQYLSIGKGTRQHALIAGKTGSGKSTLFHVMITNLALWCSPEQVEFYLVDFKKGVEFKGYGARRLPHARVVAIESDREFGLSVLQRVDDELKRRGDLFRKLGVQDIPGFKRAGGSEPMPRTLLLIDEFQEFFVEDDRISQAANLLLDRIVRQGRAFGIHVILGSQTLGGAYTLARTTIGQMVIRVALQCNEADAYLIMDENNSAPRLLTRPGEGIYNDSAGASEGNSPFQVVWVGDEERDGCLRRIRTLADAKTGDRFPGPIVFEGNAPADVRENYLLREVLSAPAASRPHLAKMWLGAPNSIKGPTEAVFQKRSGSNLLIVGQRDEAVLAILSAGLIALSAQFPRGTARFVVIESTAPGSAERDYIDRVVQAVPHELVRAQAGDIPGAVNVLDAELQRRTNENDMTAPETFLFIHGMQNFKKLRQDEDFGFSLENSGPNTAAQVQKLIAEGPSHGIHVITALDTFNNVNRFLGRKLMSEFEMRVLFQMSANDSASLCDDPKASTLGLHRALLYNEQEGHLETFRPYALPGAEWINEARDRLACQAGR